MIFPDPSFLTLESLVYVTITYWVQSLTTIVSDLTSTSPPFFTTLKRNFTIFGLTKGPQMEIFTSYGFISLKMSISISL